jgi:biotin/methionine sulfoxide reductase
VSAVPHSSHWGAFRATAGAAGLVLEPHRDDANPSNLLRNIPAAIATRARVAQPMVRAGWLEHGPGASGRGSDAFVPVAWDRMVELLSDELRRVIASHGNEGIYGGSYGWASAGRFHHAQSQLHRFLNLVGGYVRSINTYSTGSSSVLLPHVLGSADDVWTQATTWRTIEQSTELVVSFGGMPLKNTAVAAGGIVQHEVIDRLRALRQRGVDFVLVSPLRSDLVDLVEPSWLPIRPGADTALMLALAHVLISEGRHDEDFLERYCVGFEQLRDYVLGAADGQPKTPEWAAAITEIPAERIRELARTMSEKRTLITVTFSLQRAEFGEQPVWMGVALAALLGQIGLPGGGFGHGYGCFASIGRRPVDVPALAFPQGDNPVRTFIPVARISDMLLDPGAPYEYDGQHLTYPDVKLVYWSGGNPFHHHQDLGRLREALTRLDTIVVHEPFWTPMARHADFVLPSTTTLERNDIGSSRSDNYLVAMHQVVEPVGGARNDFDTFADLAGAFGLRQEFTEGRDESAWLEHLYEGWRDRWAERGIEVPPFAEFWEHGHVAAPLGAAEGTFLEEFRADPEGSALGTPSGKIELFSETVAGFGYEDCPGHPAWLEPIEWLGSPLAKRFPFQLVANNPATRLHSQLDMGETSQDSKVQGREPVRLNPADAQRLGIAHGDVVRIFNDRGSCLAGAVVSEDVRPGVLQMSTGAWYDPVDPSDLRSMCAHGNPNTVTRDAGTSRLAQACTGQLSLVDIERYDGDLPPIRAYDPPPLAPDP